VLIRSDKGATFCINLRSAALGIQLDKRMDSFLNCY